MCIIPIYLFKINNFPLKGMLSARGALLLFADADGATKFADLSKLEAAIEGMINCKLCK